MAAFAIVKTVSIGISPCMLNDLNSDMRTACVKAVSFVRFLNVSYQMIKTVLIGHCFDHVVGTLEITFEYAFEYFLQSAGEDLLVRALLVYHWIDANSMRCTKAGIF